MSSSPLLLLPLFLSLAFLASSQSLPFRLRSTGNASVTRDSFPSDFIFGALTMAVKHEGASSADGKVASIWDAYAEIDGTVFDNSTPSDCGDEYNRYEEDVKLLVDMGMDAFRLSIAWTRMLPNGTKGEVNEVAVRHYNDLINQLLQAGIEPHVTLWCQDHPLAIEEEYLGLLNPRFIDDFVIYANICFNAFGDRVKYWTTFDEPNDYVVLAYASSQSPPGRCTSGTTEVFSDCQAGNSSTEPYIVAHHFLLAHAAAVKLYREKYQATMGGQIGIALWFKWYEPLNVSNSWDIEAAKRAQDFYFGWFMDPLMYGEYPSSMQEKVASRLPQFTEEQSLSVRGSFDFIGINAVTATYAYWDDSDPSSNTTSSNWTYSGYFHDTMVMTTGDRDNVPIGKKAGEYEVPWCLQTIMGFMQETYYNPKMFIYEVGYGLYDTSLSDEDRVEFFNLYYDSLSKAISYR